MRVAGVLWAFVSFAQSSRAVFVDDAFHVDYHHALLGIPQKHTTFFHRPQASSNASLLYTISDKAYLGAVNPKDGSNLWRHALAENDVYNATNSFLVAGDRDGQIISGYGTAVSCWDAMDGKLKWEHTVSQGSLVLGLQLAHSTIPGLAQDVIVLVGTSTGDGPTTLSRLSASDGSVIWSHTDSSIGSGSTHTLSTSAKSAFIVSKSHGLLAGSKTKVSEISLEHGKNSGSHSPALDPEILALSSCPQQAIIVTSEKPYKSLKVNLLGSTKVSSAVLDDKAEEIESATVVSACGQSISTHFLVHLRSKTRQWAEVFHVSNKGDITNTYSLPATAEASTFAAQASGSETYFVRTTDSEVTLYSSASHARLGRWAVKSSGAHSISAPGQHAAAEVVVVKSGFAVRVAETSNNGHFSLLRNGEAQWSRPEVLAHSILAAWVEDAPLAGLAHDLELESSENPISAYVHRLKRHINDLFYLPQYLSSLPTSLLKGPTEPVIDVRQRLVGNKFAVLATDSKDLVGIDASSAGIVMWQASLLDRISEAVSVTHLASESGRITAYLSDGSFVVVNATTGQHIEYHRGTIPASHFVTIPASPASAVLKIDADGKPQIAADFSVPTATEGNVIVTLSEAGIAFGWTIGQQPQRTWTLRPKAGFKFTSAISRADSDPVASIGKVLGDRAVLYKYISPNLALLIATAQTSATVYLVDAVTGSVLHTSSHDGIMPESAFSAVMSENWFAFTYTYEDKETGALSTPLVISEMYESDASNDRGYLASRQNYSCFSADVGAAPYVISKAFTIAQPISQLTVTQTSQGITSRQLIAILPEANAIAAIPREILNARRPVDRDPTKDEQEEGLMKYSPILEIDPKMYLSHSREVQGVKKIITSPSLLESTSLVFAYGHDVFGTQITPSGAFDVLGKGFNRIQLMLTIVALFVGVLVIRPIVRGKTVDGQWKA